jgi:hypothetical protein
MLMGERDWVEVVGDGTEAGWGRDGKGVGPVALITALACFVSIVYSMSSDTKLIRRLYMLRYLSPVSRM